MYRLFTACKEVKPLFGFPVDMDPTSSEMLQSKRFTTHAVHLIQMIDTTINMLGPDIEMLTEIMIELGKKHVRYGVTPQMFPIMGQCLLQTIEECLTKSAASGNSDHFQYTPEMKQAWLQVYIALSTDMIKARGHH
jgi:hemoglobin-like flavoprotein